ncbi:hypothetical protein ZOSMA_99G00950 [Zostera marina]|uniref:Neprosin PEP catalytic domain-containing protein n=1 Tax=Zostera marina TaxID=29655 RepID=A0A0K9NHE9_ZOSMR|nr:hypothetical protein ZOSMA_99G00950 [Zostera marina]
MASSSTSTHSRQFLIIVIFVGFLVVSTITPAISESPVNTTTFHSRNQLLKLKRIRDHLSKMNKPSVKTIQSPDGDFIDCVPTHLQPAFDHPLLKEHKLLNPPETERPKRTHLNSTGVVKEILQAWVVTGESCPEGTIPIRRTTEEDMLRARTIRRFGKKPHRVRRDSTGSGHEHAVGYITGKKLYGAKASLNVWAPKVTTQSEFSLSQIWIISGSFGADLNTIEAGWQVSPELYGDGSPRFFTYWTSDAYRATGCYNLLCSGFIQTNNKMAIGAAISPLSNTNKGQYDISLVIWKDPKHGHWWLEFGSGVLVGYWPSYLFSHLTNHASMVQFGGEIVNTRPSGHHTLTQMGSGYFPRDGFRKAAYFRNLEVVDWDNSLIPVPELRILADHPSCYNIRKGRNHVWGNYFYYGGPGRNIRCIS